MLEKSLGGLRGISVRKASGQRLRERMLTTSSDSKGDSQGVVSPACSFMSLPVEWGSHLLVLSCCPQLRMEVGLDRQGIRHH